MKQLFYLFDSPLTFFNLFVSNHTFISPLLYFIHSRKIMANDSSGKRKIWLSFRIYL